MIQAFLEEFKQWDVEMDNPTEANIPPITIFDGLVKEVLETVRRVSNVLMVIGIIIRRPVIRNSFVFPI